MNIFTCISQFLTTNCVLVLLLPHWPLTLSPRSALLRDLTALLVAQWSIDRETSLLAPMSKPQSPFSAEEMDSPIERLFPGQAKVVLQMHRAKGAPRYVDGDEEAQDDEGEEEEEHGHSHADGGHGHSHADGGHGHGHSHAPAASAPASAASGDDLPLAAQAEEQKNQGNTLLRDGKIAEAAAKVRPLSLCVCLCV